ncbi:unnamed protein product, partial [marine sediment metagenome]
IVGHDSNYCSSMASMEKEKNYCLIDQVLIIFILAGHCAHC